MGPRLDGLGWVGGLLTISLYARLPIGRMRTDNANAKAGLKKEVKPR